MISQDELAAIAAALAVLEAQSPSPEPQPRRSRWKLADRRPELELEDIRALR